MFSAIKGFITGKITYLLVGVIISLATVIGVQYVASKSFDSTIAEKDAEIARLTKEAGSKDNRLAQQESDLNRCTLATRDMKKAADDRKKIADEELAVAKKRADDNLTYAKNLAKATPVGDNDYEATKNLMNQLIDRRNSK